MLIYLDFSTILCYTINVAELAFRLSIRLWYGVRLRLGKRQGIVTDLRTEQVHNNAGN